MGAAVAAPLPPERKSKADMATPAGGGGAGADVSAPVIIMPSPSNRPPPPPPPAAEAGGIAAGVGVGIGLELASALGMAGAGAGSAGTPLPSLAGVTRADIHISASNSDSARNVKRSPVPVLSSMRVGSGGAAGSEKGATAAPAAPRSSVHFGGTFCAASCSVL